MNTTRPTRTKRVISRIAAIWSEMDYAQRRMLEIRTGTPGLTRRDND